jgi:hypothetical protein
MTLQSEDSSKKFEEEKMLYFYLSLVDLLYGVDIKQLEEDIYIYEQIESYEACAGIKEAIEMAKHKTFKEIKIIALEIKEKYQFEVV